MKVLSIFGTRPEAIKMALLVKKLSAIPELEHRICVTGQHREMLDQVLDFFEITPHYDLGVMRKGQDLTDVTVAIILGLRNLFQNEFLPDLILVHGDTTTCMTASLSAFYHKIKIGHVEAGLRTGNLSAPFPEEANRLITDRLADMYFVPTVSNFNNLIREGISKEKIFITGNTVIDSLLFTRDKVKRFSSSVSENVKMAYDSGKRVLLVTGHRRENFGGGFENICEALKELAFRNPEMFIHYPVHMNPNVKEPVFSLLGGIRNVLLESPMDYPDFVYAMSNSWAILTDSGGVQEEGPALGKNVFVMRETTERPEALATNSVRLVGTKREIIVHEVEKAMSEEKLNPISPYGDGNATDRIVDIILSFN